MSEFLEEKDRVLAIYPTVKGFAGLIMEGADYVVDYGNVADKDRDVLIKKFSVLVDEYYISRLIVERFGSSSTRKDKARELVLAFKKIARSRKVKTSSYSKEKVDEAFCSFGSFTKWDRAVSVVEIIPTLQFIFPKKKRAIGASENLNMFVFDCAVLILTHYGLKEE